MRLTAERDNLMRVLLDGPLKKKKEQQQLRRLSYSCNYTDRRNLCFYHETNEFNLKMILLFGFSF